MLGGHVNLNTLLDWFVERGYYGGEIVDDPSMFYQDRKTLYVHGRNVSWKIYDNSPVPIYMGTAYMTGFAVNEITEVVKKVEQTYESYIA